MIEILSASQVNRASCQWVSRTEVLDANKTPRVSKNLSG